VSAFGAACAGTATTVASRRPATAADGVRFIWSAHPEVVVKTFSEMLTAVFQPVNGQFTEMFSPLVVRDPARFASSCRGRVSYEVSARLRERISQGNCSRVLAAEATRLLDLYARSYDGVALRPALAGRGLGVYVTSERLRRLMSAKPTTDAHPDTTRSASPTG
jgi:hypothetical protein